MCTAVVGGSIHRAATSISTASDQRSATPIRNHRTKDRRDPFQCQVFGSASGFSVTPQNNRLRRSAIAPDKSRRALTNHGTSPPQKMLGGADRGSRPIETPRLSELRRFTSVLSTTHEGTW